MNNNAPTRESAGDRWSPAWVAWFQQVFESIRWRKSFNYTFAVDFPNVLANSQSAAIVKTIPDVAIGDAVLVTPEADTAGLLYKGVITAANTVSLYACNFTAAPINPAATTLRVIVLQN